MNDFLIVFAIAAAFLAWLGAAPAEQFDVPQRIVSAMFQFASGLSLYAIITLTVK